MRNSFRVTTGSILLLAWMIAGATTQAAPAKSSAATPAAPVYSKAQIVSPVTPKSWSYGEMEDHKFVWDADKKELRAVLTFSQGSYSDTNNPSDREIYECPFPGVRFDEASQQFIARTKTGKDVPLAKRVKVLFGSQIELVPTARVTIYNFSGKLVVVLSGTTNPAYATGMNKWIVRPQGWYLQNAL